MLLLSTLFSSIDRILTPNDRVYRANVYEYLKRRKIEFREHEHRVIVFSCWKRSIDNNYLNLKNKKKSKGDDNGFQDTTNKSYIL